MTILSPINKVGGTKTLSCGYPQHEFTLLVTHPVGVGVTVGVTVGVIDVVTVGVIVGVTVRVGVTVGVTVFVGVGDAGSGIGTHAPSTQGVPTE